MTFDRSLPVLKIPPAPKTYSQQDQDQFRRAMEQHWHPTIGVTGGGGTVDAFATVLLPIDNGSSVIVSGMYVTAPITFGYNIVGYRLIEDCNSAGSIELMVSYATSAAFDTFTEISGTQRPQLISTKETQRTSLTGWTLTAGDAYSQLRATVVGDATDLTRIVLAIALERVDSATTSSGTSSSTTDTDRFTVWRDGSGAPSDATGNDGDYYLDDSTGDVYTRSGGHYTIVANIKGASGSAGTAGSVWYNGSGAPGVGLGVNGDYYLDTATSDVYYKSSGSWAVIVNIKGATGAAGANGTATVWHDGTGAPSNALGSDGDYYLDDSNGDVYAKSAGAWGIVTNIFGTSGGAVPTYLALGDTYTVAANTQALFAEAMDVQGVLVLDGTLVQVD